MGGKPKLGLSIEINRYGEVEFNYNHLDKFNFPLLFKQVNEAVEQYLIKPKGDLISRQAVIDLLYNIYERDIYTSKGNVKKCTAEIDISELKSLPSAAPTRLKGEWTHKGITGESCDRHELFSCSLCGQQTRDAFNYCPNCGAKMGGKQNDD